MITTTEPKLAVRASWASIVCSFILSAETWVKLAELAGFTGTLNVAGAFTLRTSWAMVGVVDAYVISALVLWIVGRDPKLAAFARKNTYAAALVGVAAQSGYHAWTAAGQAVVVVLLALVIGALPPAFAALGIHMRALGAAKVGDNGKLVAGRLELALIHGQATQAERVAELELALTDAQRELAAAATVTPEPAPAVAATPEPLPATPAVTVDPVTVPATPARRAPRAGGSRAAIVTWLTDNPAATVDKIRAQFPGVSERTAFRALADFRAA